ncbi:MAG: hypothetical protein U1E15_05370 [Hyphomicrobiales bacterium]
MKRRSFLFLLPAAAALAGCSGLKKLTKKNDSTVLPGQREDILTPDQYKLKDPSIGAKQNAPDAGGAAPVACDPQTNPSCAPAAGGNDGLFGDGQ